MNARPILLRPERYAGARIHLHGKTVRQRYRTMFAGTGAVIRCQFGRGRQQTKRGTYHAIADDSRSAAGQGETARHRTLQKRWGELLAARILVRLAELA